MHTALQQILYAVLVNTFVLDSWLCRLKRRISDCQKIDGLIARPRMKARSAVLFALSCFLCNCSLGLANAFSSFVVRDGDEGNDFDYGPRIPGNPIRKIASLTFDDTATLEGGGKRAEQKQLQVPLMILKMSVSLLITGRSNKLWTQSASSRQRSPTHMWIAALHSASFL